MITDIKNYYFINIVISLISNYCFNLLQMRAYVLKKINIYYKENKKYLIFYTLKLFNWESKKISTIWSINKTMDYYCKTGVQSERNTFWFSHGELR